MSGLVEFLRARLDEDEATAEAARRQVAERACPPPQVDEWAARAGHWGVVPWLYSGRAEADLAQWGRVEIATLAMDYIARHDPARVLAEVEAKRRILDDVVPTMQSDELRIAGEWGVGSDPVREASDDLLSLLALPYVDHPDYREEWKP
ncbi:DUF6221 family protein [Streptomyces stelliscabiei]|uniref:DUF6221 family protein n=1 Tax=Streptomyces stelliscabiei TaxID=146820 RepID=UPI0029B49F57|nr:DUF6221 family protein [Streptomyces stelliscabiei]MDX2550101.1 DUF6221 family protein [Streptomyces stelliscabiei]